MRSHFEMFKLEIGSLQHMIQYPQDYYGKTVRPKGHGVYYNDLPSYLNYDVHMHFLIRPISESRNFKFYWIRNRRWM